MGFWTKPGEWLDENQAILVDFHSAMPRDSWPSSVCWISYCLVCRPCCQVPSKGKESSSEHVDLLQLSRFKAFYVFQMSRGMMFTPETLLQNQWRFGANQVSTFSSIATSCSRVSTSLNLVTPYLKIKADPSQNNLCQTTSRISIWNPSQGALSNKASLLALTIRKCRSGCCPLPLIQTPAQSMKRENWEVIVSTVKYGFVMVCLSIGYAIPPHALENMFPPSSMAIIKSD